MIDILKHNKILEIKSLLETVYIESFLCSDGIDGTNCIGECGDNDDVNKLWSFVKSR